MFGRTPKKSDNKKYYDIFGVSKDSAPNELKKAYRNIAIKNHPDKGRDLEKVSKFCLLSAFLCFIIYETLFRIICEDLNYVYLLGVHDVQILLLMTLFALIME